MRARYFNLLVLILAFFLVSDASGQYREYLIVGKVLDTNKQPLAKVEIIFQDNVNNRLYRVLTNAKGEYKLAGLPHGRYQVTVKKEGYETLTDTWSFETPQDRMQKVEMEPIVLAAVEEVARYKRTKQAEAEFKEATEKTRQGDYDGAIAILNKMVTDNPKDANAHYLLSLNYFKKNMIPEAISAMNRTIELAPDFARGLSQLGIYYRELKETDKALEYFEKALQLDPKIVEAWYNKGLVLFELGKIPEALSSFEKALELSPDDPEFLEMAGRCYIHQKEYSRAIDCLERAKKGYTNKTKIEFLDQLITKLKEIRF